LRLRSIVAAAAAALLFGAYYLGAANYAFNRWPATEFKSLRFAMLQAMRGFGVGFDPYSRLIAYPGKTAIACPPQTDRTAIFLIIGQSNAANSGGQRFRSDTGRVANYVNGKCSVAASPLLGASGISGEPWSAISDRLAGSGSFDEVVLIPAAIGGSALSEWLPGGELHAMLKQVVGEAQRRYRITHVLWHQGESDLSIGTSEDAYVVGFKSLARDLRTWGVTAPIYVSIATRCEQIDERWSPENPINKAQRKLAGSGEGFLAGADTDSLLNALDRHDGCHTAGSGLTKVIDAWTEILRPK
jgi:hypothetical protein